MNEFLTGNMRTAYPLEHEWPSAFRGRDDLNQLLVDACVCTSRLLSESERISIVSVRKSGNAIVFKVGIHNVDTVDVPFSTATGRFTTVFRKSDTMRVFLTANQEQVNYVLGKYTSLSISPNIPLALRCVSWANNRVTAVSAYAPALCTRPLFSAAERSPVRTVGGDTPVDAILGSGDGIDVEVTSMEPVEGDILRISAIAAPADSAELDSEVDLVIRGDDCFNITVLPGTYVAPGGGILAYNSENSPYATLGATSCGVVMLSTKCKPCCQCDDYKDAIDALSPSNESIGSIKTMLDNAKTAYDRAVAAFNKLKSDAEKAVASYTNIRVSATSVASGGVYGESTASGSRSRIAVTLIVSNMTQERATVTSVEFNVPGYTMIRSQWARAGVTTVTGSSLSAIPLAELSSGDSLTVVVTMAKTSSTNNAEKPSSMTATVVAALPARADMPTRETQKTITVAVT